MSPPACPSVKQPFWDTLRARLLAAKEEMRIDMQAPRVLALIPAKAASRRLRLKNTMLIDGESLVARAVRCARASELFADIVVSTEDAEIAKMAREAGASVPFMRPPELAVDPAGVVDVTLHAIDELARAGSRFDEVIILLPTSPFRTADDIHNALRIYRNLRVDFLISVTRFERSPLSAMMLEDGLMRPLHPTGLETLGAKADGRAPVLVHSNGAVTICNVARLQVERDYYAYPLAAYEMPWQRSIDIDTELDVEFAEFLANRRQPANAG